MVYTGTALGTLPIALFQSSWEFGHHSSLPRLGTASANGAQHLIVRFLAPVLWVWAASVSFFDFA